MSKKSRFAPKLHIKKGDQVIVVAGASKGDTVREVLEVFTSENRAIVADTNMVKKHLKATNDNPGGITETPAPIHISNLMLVLVSQFYHSHSPQHVSTSASKYS